MKKNFPFKTDRYNIYLILGILLRDILPQYYKDGVSPDSRSQTMLTKKKAFLILLLAPLLRSAYAEDCQPNGLGGSYCINDDGTTSNSIPNEADGKDTLYSDGRWTSTSEDGTDEEQVFDSKGAVSNSSPDESGLNDNSESDHDSLPGSSQDNSAINDYSPN
ncbi:hypothetical protein ABK905_17795 [Acerihabitans sp. KWT182]|uniref:RND transporter n=1 Tax=Acerihabitans sp. KWT182 TaxID=3157919 RepID=A0AAU7Q6C5_9GAMM